MKKKTSIGTSFYKLFVIRLSQKKKKKISGTLVRVWIILSSLNVSKGGLLIFTDQRDDDGGPRDLAPVATEAIIYSKERERKISRPLSKKSNSSCVDIKPELDDGGGSRFPVYIHYSTLEVVENEEKKEKKPVNGRFFFFFLFSPPFFSTRKDEQLNEAWVKIVSLFVLAV